VKVFVVDIEDLANILKLLLIYSVYPVDSRAFERSLPIVEALEVRSFSLSIFA
jgi:hypothetical protein